MFIESLIIYAIDLFAICLYLSKLKCLRTFKKRELREEPDDGGGSESTAA